MSRTTTDLVSDLICFGICLALPLMACNVGDEGEGTDPPPIGEAQPLISPPIVHTGFDAQATFQVPINTDLERYEDGQGQLGSRRPLDRVDNPGASAAVSGQLWRQMGDHRDPRGRYHHRPRGHRRHEAVLRSHRHPVRPGQIGDRRCPLQRRGRSRCSSFVRIVSLDPRRRRPHPHRDGIPTTTRRSSWPRSMGAIPTPAATPPAVPATAAPTGASWSPGHILNDGDHSWELTPEEQEGIVPYLRSLAPNGFTP